MTPWRSLLLWEFKHRNPFKLLAALLALAILSVNFLKWILSLGWIWQLALYLTTFEVLCLWYFLQSRNRMASLIKSGIWYYYPEYRSTLSQGYWEQTTSSYRYLGITGGSFCSELKHWMNSDGNTVKHYEFLLLHPESSFLAQVERERLEYGSGNPCPVEASALEAQLKAKRDQFNATVATLLSTKPGAQGQVQIKVYNAYPAYWIEILDDRIILMGLLSPMCPGSQSPLVVLKKAEGYSFYDSVMDQWDRIWREAEDLS
jgi:hypothetical protein